MKKIENEIERKVLEIVTAPKLYHMVRIQI